MNLKLIREEFPTYTKGTLSVDNNKFCETLEDTNRDLNRNGKFDNGEIKVYGETCIPYGTYKVRVSYSPKFKRELPEILNVTNFSGVRIHRGNKTSDSSGCILCGGRVVNGYLYNSTPYEIKLTKLLKEAQMRNEDITLTIEKQ